MKFAITFIGFWMALTALLALTACSHDGSIPSFFWQFQFS